MLRMLPTCCACCALRPLGHSGRLALALERRQFAQLVSRQGRLATFVKQVGGRFRHLHMAGIMDQVRRNMEQGTWNKNAGKAQGQLVPVHMSNNPAMDQH